MTIATFFLGSRSRATGTRKRDWMQVVFPFLWFGGPNAYRAHWLHDPATGKIEE